MVIGRLKQKSWLLLVLAYACSPPTKPDPIVGQAGQQGASNAPIAAGSADAEALPVPTPEATTAAAAPEPNQVVLSTPQPAAAPAAPAAALASGAVCVDGDDFICRAEAAVVKATNELRAKRNLPPLTHDMRTSFVARDWSIKQGAAISHNGFPSARAAVFRDKFPGVSLPRLAAENVAMTSSGGSDPEAVGRGFVSQWEGSAGHLANMVAGHRGLGAGISCPSHAGQAAPASTGGGGFAGIFSGLAGGGCTATQIFVD